MKIAVKEHAKFSLDKMAKIALATTDRAQLDLYCVGPGQQQKAHRHDDQDKIYYVLEGKGRFELGGKQERLGAGRGARGAGGGRSRAGQRRDRAAAGPGRGDPASAPRQERRLARMIPERARRDRAGDAAGAGGMGPQSPSRRARRRHSGQGVGTAPRVTGTKSAAVEDPSPGARRVPRPPLA